MTFSSRRAWSVLFATALTTSAGIAQGPRAAGEPPPVYKPIAEYQRNNAYADLAITKIEARYEPFGHDERKPAECLDSRVVFTFTIVNRGKKAQPLPPAVLYEINSRHPWQRTSGAVDVPPSEDVAFGGVIYIDKGARKALPPGQSAVLTHIALPPRGPWNPMKLEARMAQVVVGEFVWVGVETPFRATADVNPPDYTGTSGVFAGQDGLPLEKARRWKGAALFSRKGPAVPDTIVEMATRVYQKGRQAPALSAGLTVPEGNGYLGGYGFETPLLTAMGEIDWSRCELSIKVTCGKHKLSGRILHDGNPSNDKVLKSAQVQQPPPGG
jgi:hypothetical protein